MSLTRLPLLVLSIVAALALGACGGDDDGGGGGGGNGGERAAVERDARAYIVEETADDDSPEQADSLSFDKVDINGSDVEVAATSSATGNKYEATMTKQGDSWVGSSLLTDVPSEPSGGSDTGGGNDPTSGSGREISTDEVEKQIKTNLLSQVDLDGEVECPPMVKLRRGNNFECELKGDQEATIAVTQKDDEGNLAFKLSITR